MTENNKELLKRLHDAVDLLQKAKDTGLDAEVSIEVEEEGEKISLKIRQSAVDSDYYLTGYYTPEGGRK